MTNQVDEKYLDQAVRELRDCGITHPAFYQFEAQVYDVLNRRNQPGARTHSMSDNYGSSDYDCELGFGCNLSDCDKFIMGKCLIQEKVELQLTEKSNA